jgi:predicted alpha-1,2-mannosidase
MMKVLTRKMFGWPFLLVMLFYSCKDGEGARSPADYVNPFIDSHKSRWIFFSSASRPFGMVNLSPDTNVDGPWNSSYMYDSTYIRCFSHIHAWEMSGIPVMPTVGEMRGHQGMNVYKSAFTHEGEIAKPGYHKVYLADYRVWAELTSTCRVGMHRYTFPQSDQSCILFDTGAFLANSPMDSSSVRKVSDQEIEGMSVMAPSFSRRRPKSTPVYFVAQFDKPMKAFGGWINNELVQGTVEQVGGKDAGVFVRFDTKEGEQIQVKVAISYTGIEQARKNLQAELTHWDFERVKKESFEEWNEMLGKIRVTGGTEKQTIKFYTDLWHAQLGRRTVSDTDGKYLDMTGDTPRIGQAPPDRNGKPWPHHNYDSWWGSHWSLNILWSMAYPEVMDGFCNSMLSTYKDGGLIDRGISGGNYTFVMIGDPSVSFFAAAYNKGIRNYDTELAYEALRKNAFLGGDRDHGGYEHQVPATGGGMKYYLDMGYVPYDRTDGIGFHHSATSAMTLEYAYQDWCLAQIAQKMGKQEDYELFMKRSQNYRNVWNPDAGYMYPRMMDGSFLKDCNPARGGRDIGFCESNAAVYSHYVPHDMKGLIELFGGNNVYAERLNEQFEKGERNGFRHNDEEEFWTQYTNQPGTGMAHLFSHAGYPWLTQKWVRKVKEAYGDITPYGGYYDDEDQGQMGALGVLMAIGLFEVDGGCAAEPAYEITSPIFDQVEIALNPAYYPGKTFTIKTENNSPENMYIQSARLNGKPLERFYFSHNEFVKGGILEIILGPEPNKQWGIH